MSKKIVSVVCLACALGFAGFVSAEQPSFEQLDANKDGMLTRTEAAKAGIDFAKADANADGHLDRKEYEEALS